MATDNKPKLQLDKNNKIIVDNDTNKSTVVAGKDMNQLNEPINTGQQAKSARLNNEFGDEKSPSQKKVDLLNSIRGILKTAGADSQQQYKALAELDTLLFNDEDELDYNGRKPRVIPELGNEPAGSPNPNIAASQVAEVERQREEDKQNGLL